MARPELGIFEDDPMSKAGADALELLDAQMNTLHTKAAEEENLWASSRYTQEYLDDDPKAVSARAAVEEARTWEAYRQSGAWVMHAGREYSPREH